MPDTQAKQTAQPDTPSVWERVSQQAGGRQSALSYARLAEAAVRLADEAGVDAVSMRRLAAELNVSAMTAYGYVSRKEEILELMLDRVRLEMVATEPPTGDWQAALRGFALRFRKAVLRHPWVVDLPGSVLLTPTPAYLALVEQNMAALDGLGPSLGEMAEIVAVVMAYARAGTHDEIARTLRRPPPVEQDGARAERLDHLLDGAEYPLFRRYVCEGGQRADERTRFEFGLDCLLSGISARAAFRNGASES